MSGLNWCGAAVVILSAFVVASGGWAIGLIGGTVGALIAVLDWEKP